MPNLCFTLSTPPALCFCSSTGRWLVRFRFASWPLLARYVYARCSVVVRCLFGVCSLSIGPKNDRRTTEETPKRVRTRSGPGTTRKRRVWLFLQWPSTSMARSTCKQTDFFFLILLAFTRFWDYICTVGRRYREPVEVCVALACLIKLLQTYNPVFRFHEIKFHSFQN